MTRIFFHALLRLTVTLGVLLGAWGAWGAPLISYEQETALFSLENLGPVDLSPKRVTVEVFVSPHPDLHAFHRLLPQVWPRVQQFYARMGVLLEQAPAQAASGPLSPGKRLRLEALSHKEWLAATYKAFKVDPPFRLRFLAVCRGKFAFAHLHLSTIHLDFKQFQDDIFSSRPGESTLNEKWLANLLIHELGHLFGLYHSHEFVNDPIPDLLADGRSPNFMSHYLTSPEPLGFTEFQQRLVHSYLSQGKVFQQHKQVDFDPVRYLELIKLHNRYRESQPAGSSLRGARSVAAFGDYDEEDEEDDEMRPPRRPLTRSR